MLVKRVPPIVMGRGVVKTFKVGLFLVGSYKKGLWKKNNFGSTKMVRPIHTKSPLETSLLLKKLMAPHNNVNYLL